MRLPAAFQRDGVGSAPWLLSPDCQNRTPDLRKPQLCYIRGLPTRVRKNCGLRDVFFWLSKSRFGFAG